MYITVLVLYVCVWSFALLAIISQPEAPDPVFHTVAGADNGKKHAGEYRYWLSKHISLILLNTSQLCLFATIQQQIMFLCSKDRGGACIPAAPQITYLPFLITKQLNGVSHVWKKSPSRYKTARQEAHWLCISKGLLQGIKSVQRPHPHTRATLFPTNNTSASSSLQKVRIPSCCFPQARVIEFPWAKCYYLGA